MHSAVVLRPVLLRAPGERKARQGADVAGVHIEEILGAGGGYGLAAVCSRQARR